MGIPKPTPQENFRDAALRHLEDAMLLARGNRWDNTVYLTGYVVECALKAGLAAREATFTGKPFSHDLGRLGFAELTWWVAQHVLKADVLAASVRTDGVLGFEHPHRRYWPNVWNEDDANEAMAQAERVVDLVLLRPILDEGEAFPV